MKLDAWGKHRVLIGKGTTVGFTGSRYLEGNLMGISELKVDYAGDQTGSMADGLFCKIILKVRIIGKGHVSVRGRNLDGLNEHENHPCLDAYGDEIGEDRKLVHRICRKMV